MGGIQCIWFCEFGFLVPIEAWKKVEGQVWTSEHDQGLELRMGETDWDKWVGHTL